MNTAEAMREAEVRALGLLRADPPDVLGPLVRLASRLAGVDGAEINVIAGGRQHTLASATGRVGTADAEDSFCAQIVDYDEREHVVPEAAADGRFALRPPAVSGDISTYAATQLVTGAGVSVGTLCVFHPTDHAISAEVMGRLTDIAEAVMAVLETRRGSDATRDTMGRLAAGSHELRRSNEHLAAFAGQVSHDVQGPLSGVLMALQLMGERPTAAQDPLLRVALASALRMHATVASLLDFAILDGTLDRVDLDPAALVAAAFADLGDATGQVVLHVEEVVPIWGDEVQVRLLVQNLLSNAVKYTAAVSDPRITISGWHSGRGVRVVVSDNGPGVPAHERESIFNLGERGSGDRFGPVPGLGIGLATCRRVVDAHGGRLGVDDAPGGGAAFWFELPLRASPGYVSASA